MANCKYCDEPAGMFRSEHKECDDLHGQATIQIVEHIAQAALDPEMMPAAKSKVRALAQGGFVQEDELARLICAGFARAVEHALEDNLLSQEEEDRLCEFMESLGIGQKELDLGGAFTRLVMAGALREIMEGKIPSRLRISGELPFNFESDEQLVWVFKHSKYYEDRARRAYAGGSAGVSVRVARGVYYRTGAFKGVPIESSEVVLVDEGVTAVTTRRIYFAGRAKAVRVVLDDVISFQPYDDGVSVCKDGARARPQYFVVGEGWFIYNLVRNLAEMEEYGRSKAAGFTS